MEPQDNSDLEAKTIALSEGKRTGAQILIPQSFELKSADQVVLKITIE